jgi:hypothetical protein
VSAPSQEQRRGVALVGPGAEQLVPLAARWLEIQRRITFVVTRRAAKQLIGILNRLELKTPIW